MEERHKLTKRMEGERSWNRSISFRMTKCHVNRFATWTHFSIFYLQRAMDTFIDCISCCDPTPLQDLLQQTTDQQMQTLGVSA